MNYYYQQITSMTPEELKQFKEERSDYFKRWYEAKCHTKGLTYQPR
jgi:hypothetical protein